MGPRETMSRKLEHIKLVVGQRVESLESTLLEDVRIVHSPAPEVNLDDVDTSVEFCHTGKKLRYPLMITGMTGGHPEVAWINEKLAGVAEEFGIAMGVGSQRAALEDENLAPTYSIVRKAAPTTVIVANIGAPQLSKGYGVKEARRAVEMVDADALAIHLNPGQEAFQDEGEPQYSGVIEKIMEISDSLDVPVIVKETGNGLQGELVGLLSSLGIKCFDVSGLGGTNWIKAEVLRSKTKHGEPLKPAGPLADYWGNPTGVAVVEARTSSPGSFIIGSGGIRNGLDAAKVIALGADVAGVALPALRALINGGEESLRRLIRSMSYQIKAAIYLAGERSVRGLWRAPIVIRGRLREELEGRGINVDSYITVGRLQADLWRGRGWTRAL